MNPLTSFPLLYVVVAGVVLTVFASYYLRESSKAAIKCTLQDAPNPFNLAKLCHANASLACTVIEHTGTGVIFHMQRKTLYIAQRSAHTPNLFEYARVLREVGKAMDYDRHRTLYTARGALSFLLRLTCMAAPIILVISAIAQWRLGLIAGITILAVATIFAIICLPIEFLSNKRARMLAAPHITLTNEEGSILTQAMGAMALATVQFPFQPIMDIVKAAKSNARVLQGMDTDSIAATRAQGTRHTRAAQARRDERNARQRRKG